MQNNYKSTNLSILASLLATKKCEFVACRRTGTGLFEFELSPLDVCQELEHKYLNGKLLVDAKAIADNVRMLKDMTREER